MLSRATAHPARVGTITPRRFLASGKIWNVYLSGALHALLILLLAWPHDDTS